MPLLIALARSSLRWRPPLAQTPRSGQLEELKQLSIEELADTDVTTASRRIERLADVAAAVTVITGEDLRRMGVMTLPQALRLAGHLHVVAGLGAAVRDHRARLRHQHREQDAGADRRPHRLLAGVRRRVLGNAGRRRSRTSTASR